MIWLGRLLGRLFWPSVIAAAIAGVAAVVLLLAGEGTLTLAAIALASLAGIPMALRARSRPNAGLVWMGSYAEPARTERSPGEWSSIEAGRLDEDTRPARPRR